MRNIINFRRPLRFVPIKETELDAKSRGDIPALPVGLQAIYKNEAPRTELFRLLDERILPGRTGTTGVGSLSSPSTSSGAERAPADATTATKMRRLNGAPPKKTGCRKAAGGGAAPKHRRIEADAGKSAPVPKPARSALKARSKALSTAPVTWDGHAESFGAPPDTNCSGFLWLPRLRHRHTGSPITADAPTMQYAT